MFFATEIPVKTITEEEFVEQMVLWLSGNKNSCILQENRIVDIYKDCGDIIGENGEELQIREVKKDGFLNGIGFRHNFPDNDERIWRTEVVYKQALLPSQPNLLRFRSTCIAQKIGTKIEFPKKPYFLENILKMNWGGNDNFFQVQDQPIWLCNGNEDVDKARLLFSGGVTSCLPVVYISSVNSERWFWKRSVIERMAFDLGGIAHIVVEPNREFSVIANEGKERLQVARGDVAVVLPSGEVIKIFYINRGEQNPRKLFESICNFSKKIRNQLPSEGWDWADLQECVLRSRMQSDDINEKVFYEEEIKTLREKILQLEDEKRSNSNEYIQERKNEVHEKIFPFQNIQELYDGEIIDRLKYISDICKSDNAISDLDSRSRYIFSRISAYKGKSKGLKKILDEIKNSTSDNENLSVRVSDFLLRHGYIKKSNKNHIVMEADEDYGGLMNITIPKTPSDYRAGMNLNGQIQKALGLSNLKKKIIF
ncbi:hypothetical protein AA0472_0095 [Acetobacter estunensis NRIC 0472]|uniref:Uncharacterized protein n=1 Tax=Acetobacter estunensis TaxID=104097 RepID=A0A967ECR1_9PROT|nr:hypothetical protein [Acetobacter estunensis]NHO53541.1 hypothetical protein [Acetobacter estunensis]GBQ20294.1 hypothetical protein AA0472_0095 [Acetobacter estunensis NRIC 0472]